MLNTWAIIAASFIYLMLLFGIAWLADHRATRGHSLINHASVYALSLAVYCTTWTFYGSVGRAAQTGIEFLPIYLGPTLMLALGGFIIQKLIRVAKANRITSIADFVASRYGKSQILGGLVSIIAVVGVVPYIALQLKAVSATFEILLDYRYSNIADSNTAISFAAMPFSSDPALYVAVTLAIFTILFGTRHLDATERHEGMVAAIAVESVVKLVAFTAVGLFVTYGIYDGFGDIFSHLQAVPNLSALMTITDSANSYGNWMALTILSMFSVILLPRQFQITVVENINPEHVRRAVWLFPLYLFLINIFVLPIAIGGLLQFQGNVDADMFVLTLPMAHQQEMLTLFVFIGGLSAATGMVIVETIALSTMICNDLVMPLLLRWRALGLATRSDISSWLLNIRRSAIAAILLLGYIYFRSAGEAYALVSIGLISFAAVAQFAPVVIGGLYWKGATKSGALAGLSAGFIIWLYTLLLPSFAKSGWLSSHFLNEGLFGLSLLRPQQLFGLSDLDAITHCMVWSLIANLGAYIGVSLLRTPNALEATQAKRFVDAVQDHGEIAPWHGGAQLADLMSLTNRFLGYQQSKAAFHRYAEQRGFTAATQLPADVELVHFTENLLAGTIGSASARLMVATVVQEKPLDLSEVMHILDEASQIRAYSHELEQKSMALQRATEELRAANTRLRELDSLKDDFISTVTHELRTPLTSIRVSAEIMHDDHTMTNVDRQRFLGIIVSETERLTRLINQILDLAKLESGNAEWTSEKLDINEVIQDAVTAMEQVFRDKGAVLSADLTTLPPVHADRDRLMQVMLNLLSNAAKFVPADTGTTHIRAYQANATNVCIEVIDNGPGISAEDQGIIFEKFRQGGDTLTGKPQGTGLGLPISRQIIEHFGGKLWVKSTQGNGAKFIFTLPLCQ